jgi:hypothetical protein
MTWQDWFTFFKRTTQDPLLLKALADAGFPPIPPIPRDESDVRIEKGGLMLEFLDVALCPDLSRGLGDGHGVLRAMTFVVNERGRETWPGDLPFGMTPGQSQRDLHARLGPPHETNDTLDWDRWKMEGLDVTVKYRPDRASLRRITVEAFERTGLPPN